MGSDMSFIFETARSTAVGIMICLLGLGNSMLQADEPANVNFYRPFSPLLSTPLASVETERTEASGTASLEDSVSLTGYSINFADDFLTEKDHDCGYFSPDGSSCGDGSGDWTWQCLPNGLMYKSYLAGVKEPRFATIWTSLYGRPDIIGGDGYVWDATLGGRVGVLRYGSNDVIDPQGWQLDMEGAAFPRLDLQSKEDVIGTDFRFGVPITYRKGPTSIKFGYYHLSSHLGDEFQLKYPFYIRDNYVREALLAGISHEPNDFLRFYAEMAYAMLDGGVVDPWEFKFGGEYSALARSGVYSSPFAAVHVHLREELNYSGFVNVQAGWQWRGPESDHLWRIGVQYFNGATSQHALGIFNERMVGFGMWYDF